MELANTKCEKRESLFKRACRGVQNACLLLMLAPFIILAGLIFGEKCDDIYE